MKITELKVQKRTKTNKSGIKTMRKKGTIPGVFYQKGTDSLSVEVIKKDLYYLLHGHAEGNIIVNLAIDSEGAKTALIGEVQTNPVTDEIMHVDFKGISLDQKIVVKVMVHEKGEAAGVKLGGILDHVNREIEIECLPTQIPEKIEVDITNIGIGKNLRVSDLVLPEGIVCLDDMDKVLFAVVVPQKEEEVVPVEGAEAEATTEPEVIKKGKEETEEGAEGEEAPAAKDEKKEKKEDKK